MAAVEYIEEFTANFMALHAEYISEKSKELASDGSSSTKTSNLVDKLLNLVLEAIERLNSLPQCDHCRPKPQEKQQLAITAIKQQSGEPILPLSQVKEEPPEAL